MKYVTIFHSILGIWIAVPSIYLEVVQKYCVVITERGIARMARLLRLPDGR
jgi:hypothetical protein